MKLSDLKRANDLAGLALTGLDMIAELTETDADDKAAAVLAGVRGVLSVLQTGLSGAATPAACEDALKSFRTRLEADRASADAKLADRFPGNG